MTPMVDWTARVLEQARRRRLDAESVPLARARQRHLAMPQMAVDGPRPAGHRIDARDVGAFAAAGAATIAVARRPVVAVFCDPTGHVPVGQARSEGQRWDAARPLLMAHLQEEGLDPLGWPLVAPGPEAVVAAVRDAAEGVDVVILGGVDLGDAREAWVAALERAGARGWWDSHGAPVLGLEFDAPSARAAVLVLSDGLDALDHGFAHVVRPFLRGMQGGA